MEFQGDELRTLHAEVDFEEFLSYIDSDVNSAIGDNVPQDMTRPLTEYFISSSHNTYLSGNQLTGSASADQYRDVLLVGCRCVEIDVYDGSDGEPTVTHGGTACGKVPFREVVATIRKYAFDSSEYPVVINIENHCSTEQQAAMARILNEILGQNIARWDPSWKQIPSPAQLRNRFLIRTPLSKAEPSLAQLIFLANRSYENEWNSFQPRESVSLSSNEIKTIMKSTGKGLCARIKQHGTPQFIAFTRRQMCRAYPPGGNIMSGNYKPVLSWAAGFQLVALNWQTASQALELNQGKFTMNNGCGYVLKPRYQRDAYLKGGGGGADAKKKTFASLMDSKYPAARPSDDPSTAAVVHLALQSAKMIEKPDLFESDDLYVRIQVFGAKEDTRQFRTRVSRNKAAPVWGQTVQIGVKCADLAVLRISLYDKDLANADDYVAGTVVPLPCLRPGYRNLRLVDRKGHLLYILRLGIAVSLQSSPPQAQRVRPAGWVRDLVQRTLLQINGEITPEGAARALEKGASVGPARPRVFDGNEEEAIDDEHLGDRVALAMAPSKSIAPAPSYAVANRPSAEHGVALHVFYEIGGEYHQRPTALESEPYDRAPSFRGPVPPQYQQGYGNPPSFRGEPPYSSGHPLPPPPPPVNHGPYSGQLQQQAYGPPPPYMQQARQHTTYQGPFGGL